MFEQEAPKIGTHKCSTKRGVREPFHVEFVLNDRQRVTTEVFGKKSVRANDPKEKSKIKGVFSLNNLLVGTVRHPESIVFEGRAPQQLFLSARLTVLYLHDAEGPLLQG